MQNDNTRILGYDLLKTIAIFLVVFYHTGGIDYGQVVPGEYYLPNAAKFFSAICASSVPLFFMVNGALILPRKLSLTQSIRKSAKLVIVYILSVFILQYLLCQVLLGINESMAHLWFLRTLAIIYPVCWFLEKFPLYRNLFLLFLAFIPFTTNFIVDILVFANFTNSYFSSFHIGFFTLYSILYFYLGFYLHRKNIAWVVSVIMILFGLLLINFEVIAMTNYTHLVFDSVNAAFPTIGTLFYSVGFFSLLQNSEIHISPIRNIITIIGSNTFSIYILHVLFLFAFRHFFPGWIETCNVFIIFVFVLFLMAGSLVCGIISKKGLTYFSRWN